MRIRSIKPEFWRSEDVTALTWHDRLLFIGLWSYVDDNGVGVDKLHAIAADLFAGDLMADARETFARVSRGLQTLSAAGLITRYRVEGKDYLFICTWADHQRIDKPAKGRHPLPTCGNAEIRETVATLSGDRRETLAPGTGEQGNRGLKISRAPASPGARPSRKGDHNSDPEFLEFWAAYPRKDDKAKAYTAWRQARRTASVEEIVAGAKRYASDPALEPRYTKLPATWLHAGSWENGLIPVESGRPAHAESPEERRFREERERRNAS